MNKLSGAYNQLTRILSWRGRRRHDETLPEETNTEDHPPQPTWPQKAPKRKRKSFRRLTKIIHKRRTKDSVSKETLVRTVEQDSSHGDEKFPAEQQIVPVASQSKLNNKDESDAGACAKSASEVGLEVINLGAAFGYTQDESDDDSLLNSSEIANSFFLDLALRQPLNTCIDVLEEVHRLLTDIARINRDSQERVSEKQLHWDHVVKCNSYTDSRWELANQEWTKLLSYHSEQQAKVAEALKNLKRVVAATDDEDDNTIDSQV